MSAGVRRSTKRAADNELYDRACDLVEAAMAIRRVSADRDAPRAAPALLGCLESALHELGCAVDSLDRAAGEVAEPQEVARRMHRGLANLRLAFADAELASAAARGLTERAAVAAGRRRTRAAR